MLLHNIIEKVLPNGMKVICLKKTGAPIISVQIWYKVGSVCETDGIRGISHFLEHMMFRGSANVASEEHARKINDIGGHCNAFTAEDITAYINSVPKEFLDMVLSLEADRMDGLSLDPGLFDTERKVIIEEYHTYMNNPIAKALLEFRQEFFKNHPYSLSPLGLIEDLQKVSVAQCKEYYSRWYVPSNAVLVIVGDIIESDIFDKVEKYFGSKVNIAQAFQSQISMPPGISQPHLMTRKVEFDVPLLVMGYPAPSSAHEDAVAMEILQLVISGGESSRLHKEVVRRESAAVMVGGVNQMLKLAGMSMFFAAYTPDVSVRRVENALSRQIQLLRNQGITEKEMDKVKNSTLANRTFELYSAENICHRIGYSECIEGDYHLWVERIDALKKLDRGRLVEVARKYWDDSKLHVLALKPKKTNPMLFVVGLLRRLFGRHI